MAATKIVPITLTAYDAFVKETDTTDFTAVDATDGGYFEVKGRDEQYLLIVYNDEGLLAKDVVIKAGDGLQSAFGDLTYSLAAKATAYIVLNTGRFKNIVGTFKGSIVFTLESTNVKAKVVKLPF